jgi:hypothetical protein
MIFIGPSRFTLVNISITHKHHEVKRFVPPEVQALRDGISAGKGFPRG